MKSEVTNKHTILSVLNVNVTLDVPLQIYFQRRDLWSHRISDPDLSTFQGDDDILLQHTYVILKGLERK